MPFKVQAIDHVTVNITDVARSKKFYGELLKLEELERPESFDFPGAWYRAANCVIHLVGRAQKDPESSRHFCLWVDDVKAAHRELEAAGYPGKWDKRKIPGIDRFFIQDPDGNRIEFQGSDGTVWNA